VEIKYVEGGFTEVVGPVPVPAAGQVLIRVHYSTVNPYDRIMHAVNKD
jgi:NADPH:quinone reductase-like Zn-dependent oxidoreductase